MKVSRSAFYTWRNTPSRHNKNNEEDEIKNKMHQIFYENKQVYGTRRLSKALKNIGMKVGRYKAGRLMSELGLKVRYPKKVKVTTDSNHNAAISPNTLDRQFTVESPNEAWQPILHMFGRLKAGFMWLW